MTNERDSKRLGEVFAPVQFVQIQAGCFTLCAVLQSASLFSANRFSVWVVTHV